MNAFRILVTNQKGGVGKSTITANLAAFLAIQNNYKVNLIDFDRQSSSSKWISKAPDVGVTVHHANLTNEDMGSLVLANAKRALNKFSAACDISISDLTWSHAMSTEFMLEYDLILVPSAASKFEMASTEIFVLEYVQKYLGQIKSRGQEILVVPSRVDLKFQSALTFLNLQSIDQCSIAPPILTIPAIDDFVYQDFLCVCSNESVAKNFSLFGEHIARLVSKIMMAKSSLKEGRNTLTRPSNVSILDKYRAEQHQKRGEDCNPYVRWIPDFLIKK